MTFSRTIFIEGRTSREVRSERMRSVPSGGMLFALVLLLSALYMAKELKRGWVPSDEGFLAVSAERVLRGELPHRDYHEGYTGGLSYLNAAAFRIFGMSLASMRYMFFLFFLCWVPAVYYAASRFTSAPIASALTILAVAWGPPNYAAAMPSWYNLFFATFGLAALFRYIEVRSRRWLLFAGSCGGVSFLFKPTGLYFVAGALLFLLFREQIAPSGRPANVSDRFYRGLILVSIFLYEGVLFALLRIQANIATYLYFWIPNLAIGTTIVWQEFYEARSRSQRFLSLLRELVLFGAGVVIPIALFLVPYFVTRTVFVFMRDIYIVSGRLIADIGTKPSVLWFLAGVLVNLLLAGAVVLTRSKTTEKLWELVLLGVPLVLVIPITLILARQAQPFYLLAWHTIWVLAPLIVVLGLGLLIRWSMLGRMQFERRQQLFLMLSVTAACSLIQFPFTVTIYFCYIAPLVLLSITAVVSFMERPPRLAVIGMMCFCFAYVIFDITPSFVYDLGRIYSPDIQTARLNLPRGGGLRVSAATASEYEELYTLIQRHARGEYIFATPDSPEVYFLSGFRMPDSNFYDFYEASSGRAQRALGTIHAHNINLVVLNHRPPFAVSLPDEFRAAVEEEFPSRADAGDFEVRWKP